VLFLASFFCRCYFLPSFSAGFIFLPVLFLAAFLCWFYFLPLFAVLFSAVLISRRLFMPFLFSAGFWLKVLPTLVKGSTEI
jgi:hypothetical protein